MAFRSTWLFHIPFLVAFYASVRGEGLLCGSTREVKLHSTGRTSALSLTLSNGDDNATTVPCTLNIFAPNVYALSLRIIDAENPFEVLNDEPPSKWRLRRKSEKMSNAIGKNKTVADCTLQVFYLDAKHGTSTSALKVSPCAPELVRGSLELLPQPIRVQWWPPRAPKRTDHLRLVVTAISAGEECLSKDQVVCLRAGEDPLLCVSEALACDGLRHCPEGGGDESPMLCDIRRASWPEELVKRLVSRHGELLGLDDVQFIPMEEETPVNVSVTPKREKKITALEAALAPYGPWGYLLLGTLICAMMMVLFAIWECFCHHIKPPQVPVPPDCEAPAAVVLGGSEQPLRRPPAGRGPPPPTYEELEQPPPPYSALFPRANKTNTAPDADLQEATTSAINL